MNKTKIEWCDFTWNPVTGCKRGCNYCYARRIHERFHKTPFSDIVFHPQRMYDPASIGRFRHGARIFVGSMSDIEYWDKKVTEEIIAVCRVYYRHTFMFLSKNPDSYDGFTWPQNCMCGLTMTKIPEKNMGELLMFPALKARTFLSIEPIMGPVEYFPKYVEQVIVGAMTGPGAVAPRPEWIQSIKDNVPAEKIFWKSNIKKYL